MMKKIILMALIIFGFYIQTNEGNESRFSVSKTLNRFENLTMLQADFLWSDLSLEQQVMIKYALINRYKPLIVSCILDNYLIVRSLNSFILKDCLKSKDIPSVFVELMFAGSYALDNDVRLRTQLQEIDKLVGDSLNVDQFLALNTMIEKLNRYYELLKKYAYDSKIDSIEKLNNQDILLPKLNDLLNKFDNDSLPAACFKDSFSAKSLIDYLILREQQESQQSIMNDYIE